MNNSGKIESHYDNFLKNNRIKKYKKIIFYILLIGLFIYFYEKRDYYTANNDISISIWKGKFGEGVYYLYPYKCFDIFRGRKDYIRIDSRNQYFELRFINNKTLVIWTYKMEYIDVKLSNYKIEKIYTGYEGRKVFDSLYPCEKCKACYNWGNIWEIPHNKKKNGMRYSS
ncbi:MAG: hypothetical protein LBL74_00335 [Bacteroidales bacterium]|jgi:hypothetical protein|nr:hypothetical protein [Bacteroidales bacterium]